MAAQIFKTQMSIIGEDVGRDRSHCITSFNPALNSPNPWEFYTASSEEIDLALELAHKATEPFLKTALKCRAKFLAEIVAELQDVKLTLMEAFVAESGLSSERAEIEFERTLRQLDNFVQLLEEGEFIGATINLGDPIRSPKPQPDLRKMLVPIGPIAVFGSSNFPLAYSTAGGDTISALAAGCPVIVKAHPMHLATGTLVATAIQRAAIQTGMPNGVFSNLICEGHAVGAYLVQHQVVKAVGFTGSITGGRALFDLAAKRPDPIPVFAEMGSTNPVLFFEDGLKKKESFWSAQFKESITNGAGQFCTCPGLLIGLASESFDTFVEYLVRDLSSQAETCMLGPSIRTNFQSGVGFIHESKGVVNLLNKVESASDYKVFANLSAVNGQEFLSNTKLQDEVFGPFSLVVRCADLNEMREVVSALHGQLTGTVIGSEEELKLHKSIVNCLMNRVGRLIFNGVPTGVETVESMHHGGPYPASTDARFTAVGIHAIQRWLRPVSFQNCPDELLPPALQNKNPLEIYRKINGFRTKEPV